MRLITSAVRAAPAAFALIALAAAGCDKPKPRPPIPPGPEAAAPAAAPAAQAAAEAMPAQPAWAQALIGKPLKDAFPDQSGACVGNTDDVDLRYQGATPGVRVEGWGWDPAARKAIAHVLLTDEAGKVVGAGETGKPRPDVPAARKDITDPATGWQAVTATTKGGVYAFGILADGKTLCRLGHLGL